MNLEGLKNPVRNFCTPTNTNQHKANKTYHPPLTNITAADANSHRLLPQTATAHYCKRPPPVLPIRPPCLVIHTHHYGFDYLTDCVGDGRR